MMKNYLLYFLISLIFSLFLFAHLNTVHAQLSCGMECSTKNLNCGQNLKCFGFNGREITSVDWCGVDSNGDFIECKGACVERYCLNNKEKWCSAGNPCCVSDGFVKHTCGNCCYSDDECTGTGGYSSKCVAINGVYPGKCVNRIQNRVCSYYQPCCTWSTGGGGGGGGSSGGGSGGSTNTSPGGGTTSPGSTVTTGTPNDVTTPAPQYFCEMCEVDGDGTVSQGDIDKLNEKLKYNPSDTFMQGLIQFCTANCMGKEIHPPRPTSINPSGLPGDQKAAGDCAGPGGPGNKDGITDMYDVGLYREEFSGDAATTFCDFNKSGKVDLYDFPNLRIGYQASN